MIGAGCVSSAAERSLETDEPSPGAGLNGLECHEASDCVAASSSCCECPTFAVPKTAGYEDVCDGAGCSPPDVCSATRVGCHGGSCVLECATIPAAECATPCPSGYMRDEFGCLTCTCVPEGVGDSGECMVNSDCVRVSADCCGCERGGQDRAIPKSEADSFEDGMGCQTDSPCPEVSVCDDRVPQCVEQTCVLAGNSDPESAPPTAHFCGYDGALPCPEGTQCVLNEPGFDDANELGVGTCQPE